MAITAEMVKELRERSGSGMMDCKKALVEANGDIDLALEKLRIKGIASADKKLGKIAAEGVIIIQVTADSKKAVMLEVNCQTDFVGRDESFRKFANQAALSALENAVTDVDALASLPMGSQTIEDTRRTLVATLGENIQLRRLTFMTSSGSIGSYLHGDRIGVLVNLSADAKDLGKDIAMHIAASKPSAVSADDIPEALVDKEREIFLSEAQASGKSSEVIEKIVEGRIKKFKNEEALLGQPFVKDPSLSVESLLSAENVKVHGFIRYEVGEGIEKKVQNFAEEVMAQVHGDK